MVLRDFRGALGGLKPTGLTVCGEFFCAPEPVAFVRKRPLSGRFSSVPVVKILKVNARGIRHPCYTGETEQYVFPIVEYEQAQAVKEHVDATIGMTDSISDSGAAAFAAQFYLYIVKPKNNT